MNYYQILVIPIPYPCTDITDITDLPYE